MLSQENGSLVLTAPNDSASSPGRRSFRRDPAVRPNFGTRQIFGTARMLCLPPPLPWLCKGTDVPTAGPKTLRPCQPLESLTPKGDKEKVPSGPSSERRDLEVQSPAGVRTRRPPIQAPARHSPVRSPRRGGAQGAGSSVALPASDPTLTSLGRCRQRQLGNEPRPRALSRRRRGAAGSAHQRGGNAGLAGHRPGRDPAFAPSAGYGWRPTLQPPGLPLPLPPVPERVAA